MPWPQSLAYLRLNKLGDAPPPTFWILRTIWAMPPPHLLRGGEYGLYGRAAAIHFFCESTNLV